jgi:hypothetical protein
MDHYIIDNDYPFFPLTATIFEKGKTASVGYHFISVQATPESEEVEGFWLMRQFDDDL